jgi:hypothetical protein
MITFTVVDGQAYPGELVREGRRHHTRQMGFYSYLSADLGGRHMHIEKWDFEGAPVSVDELRSRLANAIRERR